MRPARRMIWQAPAVARHRAPIISVMLASIYAVGQRELAPSSMAAVLGSVLGAGRYWYSIFDIRYSIFDIGIRYR